MVTEAADMQLCMLLCNGGYLSAVLLVLQSVRPEQAGAGGHGRASMADGGFRVPRTRHVDSLRPPAMRCSVCSCGNRDT